MRYHLHTIKCTSLKYSIWWLLYTWVTIAPSRTYNIKSPQKVLSCSFPGNPCLLDIQPPRQYPNHFSGFYHYSLDLLVFHCHINGIIQYVFFRASFTQGNVSKIQSCCYIYISESNFLLNDISLYVYHNLVIYSPDGHLGCFWSGTTMSKAAINVHAQVFEQTDIFNSLGKNT